MLGPIEDMGFNGGGIEPGGAMPGGGIEPKVPKGAALPGGPICVCGGGMLGGGIALIGRGNVPVGGAVFSMLNGIVPGGPCGGIVWFRAMSNVPGV